MRLKPANSPSKPPNVAVNINKYYSHIQRLFT